MHGWSWSAQHPVPGPPPQPAADEFEVILNFFPALKILLDRRFGLWYPK